MPSVVLYAPATNVLYSTPVLNTIKYFVSNGYEVFLFSKRDLRAEELGIEKGKVIKIRFNKLENYSLRLISKINTQLSALVENFLCARKMAGTVRGANLFITYEQRSDTIALFLSKKIKKIYHSLEIEKRTDYSSIDRRAIKKYNLLLTQDIYRARILNALYRTPFQFRVCYNAPTGEVKNQRSDFFRKRYSIKNEDYILLVSGSLCYEHQTLELVHLFLRNCLDLNVVLLIHGWTFETHYHEAILGLARQYSDKVFYSDVVFKPEEKDILYSSVDIGLIGYSKETLNHRFVGWSSGKIFEFMQNGIPVLYQYSYGIEKLISPDKMIGEVFDNDESFRQGLLKILDNYAAYQQKCREAFPGFEFSSRFTRLMESYNLLT
jgi:hypothetical protein